MTPPPPASSCTAPVELPAPPSRTSAPRLTGSSFPLRHRSRPWVIHYKLVALSFLGDFLLAALSQVLAFWARFESPLRVAGVQHEEITLASYLGHMAFGTILLAILLANFRAHDPLNFLSFRRTFPIILKSTFLWLGLFLALSLVLKFSPPISRFYGVLGFAFALPLLLGWRWFLHCILRQSGFVEKLRQKAVFVGWNRDCERALRRFSDGRGHPVTVTGVIAPPSGRFEAEPPGEVKTLGRYDQRRRVLRESGADLVFAVDGALAREDLLDLAELCGKELVDFKLVPSCFQVLLSGLQLENINGMPVLGVGRVPLHHAFNIYLKQSIDLLGGLVGLVLFGPVIALFGLLVYLESPGPVFYRQRRVGLNGRPFDIIKLRSMKLDAETCGAPGWTVKDDPRRLRIGAFMRAWNIDELPQFWNVLRGEMSLVGPRPERPELIENFQEQIPYYNVRHQIKPGITGWAQVNGLRGDTCLHERVKFDLQYIEDWNVLLDFQIMLMTFLNRKGAC